MRVLITGGAGYVGSMLVPQLLDDGHEVTVYDACYFGSSFLPLNHGRLRLVQADIRDLKSFTEAVHGQNAVIHLACISNDASFELDEELSTSVNLDAFLPLVLASKAAGVERFIYASSSSVYGVSEERDVKEDHELRPLTLYNKFKGECEPLLLNEISSDFVGVVIRPATLCGYAPRQRLDLSVNILTNHAINKGEIRVFGGSQLRPNLHVRDMVRAYQLLLSVEATKIQGEIFNCGYQNMSIRQIAEVVRERVGLRQADGADIQILTEATSDLRSYHVNSDKIRDELHFKPTFSVADAVDDLCEAFARGDLPGSFSDSQYFNVQRMKELKVQ